MVFPFEFSFTSVIVTPAIFNELYTIALDRWVSFASTSINVIQIFIAIGVIVSCAILLSFSVSYARYHRHLGRITKFRKTKDDRTAKVLESITNRSKRKLHVNILYSPEISMPMGVGVFKKYILLPDYEYSDDEIFYTLLHEYTHFLNRDLLVKMLIHIYCCIFWWNPTVFLLRKDLEQTLEIKCDLAITSTLNKIEKINYMQVIASAIRKSMTIDPANIQAKVTSRLASSKSSVMERLEFIALEKPKNYKLIKTMLFYMFSITVFTLSYMVVLQPKYDPPQSDIVENDPNAYEMTPQNTYILKTKDGRYILKTPDGKGEEINEYFKSQMIEDGFGIREK